MTYVDRFKTPYGRMRMSHLLADTLAELHAMAAAVGLKAAWFQTSPVPHYDLCQQKRAMAVTLGAKEIGRRETAEVMRRIRATTPQPA